MSDPFIPFHRHQRSFSAETQNAVRTILVLLHIPVQRPGEIFAKKNARKRCVARINRAGYLENGVQRALNIFRARVQAETNAARKAEHVNASKENGVKPIKSSHRRARACRRIRNRQQSEQ